MARLLPGTISTPGATAVKNRRIYFPESFRESFPNPYMLTCLHPFHMHRIQTLYFPNEMSMFAPHFPQLLEYGPTVSLTP